MLASPGLPKNLPTIRIVNHPPVTMRWSPTLMRLFGLRRLPKHVLLQRWSCLVGQAKRAEIREALPHFDRVENLEGLRLVLTLLGYGTTPRSVRMSDITDEVMPCLFSHDGAAVMLIVERGPDSTLLVFDGRSASWKNSDPDKTAWFRILCLESPQQGRVSGRRQVLAPCCSKAVQTRNRCYAGFQLSRETLLRLRSGLCHFRLRPGNWQQVRKYGDHACAGGRHCDCHQPGIAEHSGTHHGLFRRPH